MGEQALPTRGKGWVSRLFPPEATRGTGPSLAKNELDIFYFSQNCLFHNSGWNWGGLEVSRVTAQTVRRQRNIFSRDLVSHGIEKSTFQHFPANWHFKVLEMAPKPSILSRVSPGHLYYLFLDISPTYFQQYFTKIKTLENWKSENIKSRSWKVSWFVFSQRWTSNRLTISHLTI